MLILRRLQRGGIEGAVGLDGAGRLAPDLDNSEAVSVGCGDHGAGILAAGPCEPGKGRPSVARAFSSGYAA